MTQWFALQSPTASCRAVSPVSSWLTSPILIRQTLAVVLTFAVSFGVPISSSASGDEYKPKIADASRDAELALEGFVLPEGMSGSLVAAEPLLANPVAFFPANDGSIYICETFRQQVGVEDNRSHMDWLHNDLRLQTVEERLAMFRKYLGPDVEKYGVHHDRIRLLRDTDGDGKVDSAKVFADGFNGILEGTGAGVLEHDGNVFYTCIPKLWSLKDTDGDDVADERSPLHHGYGVRVAFRGHDMHGLTVGPDGRLYFSIGDRGYNVITQEGTRLHRPDTGAVFRCDMDGSHLEVFAYGLRNPQELVFDDYGNLWTGDNNSDSGDQARWVYVVQDGDTGWRMYFQYLDDRGPWNRERMWYPYRSDDETTDVQPAYIVPPVANLGDGPSGLTYYPGLGLSDRYENHFFMADFRGGSSNSGIRSFSVKSKGASFELTDSHQFIWSILGTDVDFSPDGGLYVSDWVNGWDGEGKGRLYRFVDDENVTAVEGANVASLLNGGIKKLSNEQLPPYLSHADRRVRMAAQFELVNRPESYDDIFASAIFPDDDVTHRHLAWAMWQISLKSTAKAQQFCDLCVAGAITTEGDLGIQYTRILADVIRRYGVSELVTFDERETLRGMLIELTASPDLRHAGFAAVALGAVGYAQDLPALYALLSRNNNEDAVLRHQAVMGMTEIGRRNPDALNFEDVVKLSPAARLGTVVALRRLKREQIVRFLDDADVSVVAEAARAISEHGSHAALNKLAFPLLLPAGHPDGISDPVVVRRALEAAYRLGGKRHALVVARVAGDAKRADELRLVAAKMLNSWNSPQQTDTVTGKWRPLPTREVNELDRAIRDDLPGMLAGPGDVRREAIEVAAKLGIKDVASVLQRLLKDKEQDAQTRVSAFQALVELTENPDDLISEGRTDQLEEIRLAALETLAKTKPDEAVAALAETIASGSTTAQQQALRLLGGISGKARQRAAEVLNGLFRSLSAGDVSDAIVLDLLSAAEANGSEDLQKEIDAFRKKQQEAGTTLALWSECLQGGNAARGYTIFFGRAAASCRRCHKVNGDGADVGPDLSAVAKDKDRQYLLESIIDPNAKIAKGFETTIIVDIDGRIHSGIIREETDDVVKLVTPKGGIITVAKDDIDERAKGQSGMPSDIAKNMSRSEIRDLVEYLTTLKQAKDAAAHGEGE